MSLSAAGVSFSWLVFLIMGYAFLLVCFPDRLFLNATQQRVFPCWALDISDFYNEFFIQGWTHVTWKWSHSFRVCFCSSLGRSSFSLKAVFPQSASGWWKPRPLIPMWVLAIGLLAPFQWLCSWPHDVSPSDVLRRALALAPSWYFCEDLSSLFSALLILATLAFPDTCLSSQLRDATGLHLAHFLLYRLWQEISPGSKLTKL